MPTLEVEKIKKPMHPKVKMALAAVAGLLLIGGLWGLWTWLVESDKKAYEAAVATQKAAGLTRDYAGAIEAWEGYRSRWWPRNYDYEAILNEAGLYRTMRNNTEAMKMYRMAEPRTKGDDTAAYEGIASIAEEQGDYVTALEYYQKVENIYAKQKSNSSKWAWVHTHVEMLKDKVKNAQ